MTTASTVSGTKPTHRIYSVTGEGKSAFWKSIGAAWPNKDGDGFSIQLDAIPLQGRTVMRRIAERPTKGAVVA